MQHDIQVLDRVKSAYATLRPSEQRVADQVLADPEKCTRCTIAELADQVQVSQPTVVRFVQALGFDGYRSFKYCLLRDRSGKSPKSPYFDHLGDFEPQALGPPGGPSPQGDAYCGETVGGRAEIPLRRCPEPRSSNAGYSPDH